jgi:hypothetical protein
VKSGVTVQPPKVTGDGILIFHAADRTSRMKGLEGLFKGIIIADQVEHLHGTFYGGIIGLADTQPDAILGNGNAILRFSRKAILKAQAYMKKEGKPSIIAWWE